MTIQQAIRNPVRIFNKYILNKLTRNLVWLPFGPFALVRHVGRRSGKLYETTIFVFHLEDGFMVVLTYGPEVDWYRNVQAAGHCEIVWHGKTYATGKPESMDKQSAWLALPQPEKTILEILGTQ